MTQTKYKIGDKVQVRNWFADQPIGNWRSWVGPWQPGEIHSFDKYGNPWVVYRHAEGYQDARYFGPEDIRLRAN